MDQPVRTLVSLAFSLCWFSQVFASDVPSDSLKGVRVPPVPQLRSYITQPKLAVQLGKSLFWDMNVGSDGVACASCHFHAGADHRVRNQLNPGSRHTGSSTAFTLEPLSSGAQGGPDYALKSGDFPFWRFLNPNDRQSHLLFSTDDVVGSAGVFKRTFQSVDGSAWVDQCETQTDDIFHVRGRNTRRVTDRNAPTVINAAFNFRQFWDGRANNAFNGETAWGARDPNAGVWIVKNGKPLKRRILLKNASLASLAVAPPMNDVEMTCAHRSFADIGRKLLKRRALEGQPVHPEDSVLGNLVDASGRGLSKTYEQLIEKSFARRYWKSVDSFGQATDGTSFTQMEANFPLFFGLAIQQYLETLVSDQSPFDSQRDKDNVPVIFNEQQRHGLALFKKHQCFICHLGPTLSSAAHPKIYNSKSLQYLKLVDRSAFNEESDGVGVAKTLVDVGYAITSVAPLDHDLGLIANDPWGHPLSYSQQYLDMMQNSGATMVDDINVLSCEFSLPFTLDFNNAELRGDPQARARCKGYEGLGRLVRPEVVKIELQRPAGGRLGSSVDAAFKIPTLRNIELTGPYMHNGSMKSLEEVVQFYNRGGNYVGNPYHFETVVFPQGMTEQDQADLVAFLKTLTDERVRWEQAPFDHPGLKVPHGHLNQGSAVLGDQVAEDDYLIIPAVGRNGRSPELGPLQSFEQALAH